MANKNTKSTILAILKQAPSAMSLKDISSELSDEIPERTLRRWLSNWVNKGHIIRSGTGRATRYMHSVVETKSFKFLDGLDDDLKTSVIQQLRDLWTHTSTAIEGNTLTLGDTHYLLEEGLTVSGKPLKDHQEVIGHARAIDLFYESLSQPLNESIIFEMHKAIQSEVISDIYKPYGAWKVEPNGVYAISSLGQQTYIEFAPPDAVPILMKEFIDKINSFNTANITQQNAHEFYAKTHMGFVHIHPFWDGNGRLARLLGNIPLLKAGLPPLMIPIERRRSYIETLADYQISIGQLDKKTGVWPDTSKLKGFEQFCKLAYKNTNAIIEEAKTIQKKRK